MIEMKNAIAELDGDEMTRVLWRMIKDTLLTSYIDLKTEYYDLSLPHRDETRDRVVEPFSFTANMIDVWAYDVEKDDCRVFKVMRIGFVEETETPWAFEDKHEVKKPDVFRMTGSPVEKIVLQLNTRAKSLLVEEYPLAERDLKREDGNWVLQTTINSVEGAGRFVIGLAADIKILQGKKLLDYIKKYDKKHIQKL